MRKVIAVFALVAAAGWTAAADDDAAEAAKKLEGTYTVLEGTRGGKPEPKTKEITEFVIKDGGITIRAKDKDKADTAKFTLDPSKKPAHIDIMPGGDRSVPGIYQTKETEKGLELTIAFARGPDAERPKDFKGEAENVMVLKMLRKKEK